MDAPALESVGVLVLVPVVSLVFVVAVVFMFGLVVALVPGSVLLTSRGDVSEGAVEVDPKLAFELTPDRSLSESLMMPQPS